jgi:hypothetical protein
MVLQDAMGALPRPFRNQARMPRCWLKPTTKTGRPLKGGANG